MTAETNTSQTYNVPTIREDLAQAYAMVSPEETPFISSIGTTTATNTLHEWSEVTLATQDSSNRVIEGEDSPSTDAPNNPVRLGTHTQISDKKVVVSETAQAVNGAADNIQRMGGQIMIQLKQLKIDMEGMLLDNVADSAGTTSTARQTAGLPAWLRTNTNFGTGGADPTISNGLVNAAATSAITANLRLFAEADFNAVMQSCWDNGGKPSLIMCNSNNKRRISAAFTGNSTRYKDAIDARLVQTIDFYSSDFGELTVVPNRFQRTLNPGGTNDSYYVALLDPKFASVAYLQTMKQKPLAETGHAQRRLIWCEYALQIDSEKAHGIIRDTNGNLS